MGTPKHVSQTLSQIATPGSSGVKPTTGQRVNPSSPEKIRGWLDRWIKVKAHHLAILRLEHEIWEFTRGYSASPALGKRLVIYGGSGNGKTHIAKAVHRWANKIAMNLPTVPTGNATQMKLADSVFYHWPTVVDNFKQGEWDLQDLVDASLRIIDDIGAEHDPSGVGKQKLYNVLEHTERKWSIITTNFGPAEWENKFETRTADRLFRNAIHFDLSDVPSFSAK